MGKSTDLSMSQQNLSMSSRIAMALTEANCFRGAEVTEKYLRLFTARLERENPNYLFQALTNLGERVRGEGENSLLNLATILEEIKILTPRPKTLSEQEADEMFEERKKAMERIQ